MRIFLLGLILLCITSSSGMALRSNCNTSPPAGAAAEGLTYCALGSNFTDTTDIDTTDSRVDGYVLYTHNAWPNTGIFNCGTNVDVADLCAHNLLPTLAGDYSTNSSGLQITPRRATTTGNNTTGTNTITDLSVSAGALPTTGLILVYGPGIPTNTNATISGTTATLWSDAAHSVPRNTTGGSTGGTYYFQVVYNGWMFESAGYSSIDSRGYVGTVFQPPFYIESHFDFAFTPDPQYTAMESGPGIAAWSMNVFLQQVNIGNVCELDYEEAVYGRSMHTESTNGDGFLYWTGHGPSLVTETTTNTPDYTGAFSDILVTKNKLGYYQNGTLLYTVNYGRGIVPTITNGAATGSFIPAGTPPSGALADASGSCDTNYYKVTMNASPNWPASNVWFRVWTKPPPVPSRLGVRADTLVPFPLMAGEYRR